MLAATRYFRTQRNCLRSTHKELHRVRATIKLNLPLPNHFFSSESCNSAHLLFSTFWTPSPSSTSTSSRQLKLLSAAGKHRTSRTTARHLVKIWVHKLDLPHCVHTPISNRRYRRNPSIRPESTSTYDSDNRGKVSYTPSRGLDCGCLCSQKGTSLSHRVARTLELG